MPASTGLQHVTHRSQQLLASLKLKLSSIVAWYFISKSPPTNAGVPSFGLISVVGWSYAHRGKLALGEMSIDRGAPSARFLYGDFVKINGIKINNTLQGQRQAPRGACALLKLDESIHHGGASTYTQEFKSKSNVLKRLRKAQSLKV